MSAGWDMLEMLVEKPRNRNVNGRLERKLDLFQGKFEYPALLKEALLTFEIACASIADCERSSSW